MMRHKFKTIAESGGLKAWINHRYGPQAYYLFEQGYLSGLKPPQIARLVAQDNKAPDKRIIKRWIKEYQDENSLKAEAGE